MVFLSFCLHALYSSTNVNSSDAEQPLGDDVSISSISLTLDVIPELQNVIIDKFTSAVDHRKTSYLNFTMLVPDNVTGQ